MKAKRYEITFKWLKNHCLHEWNGGCLFHHWLMRHEERCTEANCPLLKRRREVK